MRSLFLILLFISLSVSAIAQDTPKIEVFSGFSLMKAGYGGGVSPSLIGFDSSINYNISNFLGIKADFSGQFNGKEEVNLTPRPPFVIPGIPGFPGVITPLPGSSAYIRSRHFLFMIGPQIAYRKKERIQPFGHILFGVDKRKIKIPINVSTNGNTTTTTYVIGNDTGFGIAVGGGVDIKIARGLAFRPLQLDYIMSTAGDNTNNMLRFSTGVVMRFGN